MKGNKFISKKKEVKREKKRSASAKRRSENVAQIMNGEFLTKDFVMNNLPYILFLIVLGILIVSKGYYVHQLASDIAKEEEKVKDYTADYVETKAKLEEATRRAVLNEKLRPLGLKETINPTKVIRLNKEEGKE